MERVATIPQTAVSQTCLVLDDDEIQRILLADVLSERGLRVIGTARTAEALEIVASTPLVFALLDIQIGRTASFDVANALILRKVPYAFVSGHYQPEELIGPYRSAILLRKPYSQTRLDLVVNYLLAEGDLNRRPAPPAREVVPSIAPVSD